MGSTSSTPANFQPMVQGAVTATANTPSSAFAQLFPKDSTKLGNMVTPGWQFVRRAAVFIVMIIVFGIIYQFMIGYNPEEWAHPTDENGHSIINGAYAATVISSTVGYGDYYPYSQRGMILVVLNVLTSWIVATTILS